MAEQVHLSFDRGALVLTGSDEELASDSLPEGLWLWDARLGASRTEAFHYREVREELGQAFGERLADEVRKPAHVKWPRVNLPEFRPEQRTALESWRSSGRRGQAPANAESMRRIIELQIRATLLRSQQTAA